MANGYGVCYDLRDTPYRVDYGGYTFCFSSANHERRFRENARIRVGWLEDSMSRRFHFHMTLPDVALFQLYRQIEQRGFRVECSDGTVLDRVTDVSFEVRRSER